MASKHRDPGRLDPQRSRDPSGTRAEQGDRRRRVWAPGDLTANRATMTPIDYSVRPVALRTEIERRDLDAIVVTEPTNIAWLCGFSGTAAALVVTVDAMKLIVDGRYGDRAAAETTDAGSDVEVVVARRRDDARAAVVGALGGAGDVGAESARMSHAEFVALAEAVPLIGTVGVVEALRRNKQPGEIERISAAARIADQALADVVAAGGETTEHEMRLDLEDRMQRLGADAVGFETIVASGPNNGARPHHRASRRRIRRGDTLIIDLGAIVDGYHSDMTRSYVVGEPSEQQRRRFESLREAQRAGIAAARPGVAVTAVDAACRTVLEDAGCGDLFIHGTGHGVGLEIHEPPFIGSTGDDVLRAGDVVTIEPGMYEPGMGGFRIEDLVVVGDTPTVLTHAPVTIEFGGARPHPR